MIVTSYTDQTELLMAVQVLYCPLGFELDPCYGNGNFYKNPHIDEPRIAYDLKSPKAGYARVKGEGRVYHADVRNLPLISESIKSIIFDPPFIHAAGKNSVMGKQFGSYPSQEALFSMYGAAMDEFVRVLKPGGILCFKNQDIVEAGKQVWNHVSIYNLARACAFVVEDLFILVNGRKPIKGHNHGDQKHARRNHSYFWVFRKT